MGYLRTNFKRTGGRPLLDIGEVYALTSSPGGGAGTSKPYAGFVIGDNRVLTGTYATEASTMFGISAYGLMSAWYGGGVYNSGYAFNPIDIQIYLLNPSVPTRGSAASAAADGANAKIFSSISGSIVYFYAGGVKSFAASSFSAHFRFAGFITSGP